MQVRNRLKVEVYTGSRTERFGSHVTNTRSYESVHESCEDVTGEDAGDNQPLYIERYERSGGLINGVSASALTGYIWNGYPCAYVTDAYTVSHLSIPGQPSDGSLATSFLARTQPYAAKTQLWEYADELAGYGSLAQRKFGERLGLLRKVAPPQTWRHLKFAARLNLLYQFGIRPLISDIETLLSFQQAVDRRVDQIKRVYGPRGYRRTADLWSGSNVATVSNQIIQSQGSTLTARINKSTSVHVRGHVRWRALFPVQKSDAQLRRMARQSLLGTDFDPYTAWELMPWSWLSDYFLNLGNLVKAAKNMTTITHDAVRIIEHRRTRTFSSNHSLGGGSVTCTPMNIVHETKKRTLAVPTLNAQESILTDGQLSILGSLTVLKGL